MEGIKMSKYTFKCEHDCSTTVIYETEEESLYDLYVDFIQFLKACGFCTDDIDLEKREKEFAE